MEADRTILTNNEKIAEAIRRSVPDRDRVLKVEARFLELTRPGFNSEFEPNFCVANPADEKKVRDLCGQVICALPPNIPGSDNVLLYNVAVTLQNRPASVLYAPLPSLHPDAIQQALAKAARPDPWFITSMVARRITQQIISLKAGPLLKQKNFELMEWMSYFYLYLIDSLSQKWWTRNLFFGGCKAAEIDMFGGAIYHLNEPALFTGEFAVKEKQIDSEHPDPRFRLNEMFKSFEINLEESIALLNALSLPDE